MRCRDARRVLSATVPGDVEVRRHDEKCVAGAKDHAGEGVACVTETLYEDRDSASSGRLGTPVLRVLLLTNRTLFSLLYKLTALYRGSELI